MATKQAILIAWLLSLALVAGCATLEPMQAAETTEQRAFAAYGTFTVYEEAAADLMRSESVPDSAKARIQRVDADAKPVADSLLDATKALVRVRNEYREGEADAGAVRTAIDNVERWAAELEPVLSRLVSAVQGAAE